MSDQHDSNVTEQPLYRWTNTNNIGFLDVPASLQRSTGFTSIPTNSKVTQDQQTRLYFQADSTVYAKMGGDHQIKFGVQADRVGNKVAERRIAQPRLDLLEPGAGGQPRHLRLLLGAHARTWRRSRA